MTGAGEGLEQTDMSDRRVRRLLAVVLVASALPMAVVAGEHAAKNAPLKGKVPQYEEWPFAAKEAKRRQQETAKALGVPIEKSLNLGNNVKLTLVLVPTGEFVRGSAENEFGRFQSEVQHRVTMTEPFYMGKFEVTQHQFFAVTRQTPSTFKGASNPVNKVSWEDADAFCKKTSAITKQKVRLPTEAEWEYACRAGTQTAFWFGKTISTEQANYSGNNVFPGGRRGNNREKTVPVGGFPANAFGLHDMHGNVWEWCQDWLAVYSRDPATDPKGPAEGGARILRGGSYVNKPEHCRSAFRYRAIPGFHCPTNGLRVAVDP